LNKRGFPTAAQLPLAVNYEGERIDLGFRVEILVENTVVVEIKAVNAPTRRLITFLKLSRKQVGLLINFNVVHLKDGIRRMVCGEPPSVSSVSSVVTSLVST
jgi:GxxExxY protein